MNLQPGTIIKRRISGIFWHMGIYIGKEKVIHYHNPTHGKDKGILGKTGALTLVAIAIVTTAVGAKKVSEKNSGIKRQERRVDLSYAR